MPSCSAQRASTRAGVRQDMPPLTTVDPPTHRPSAYSTDGRPIAIPPPPSRYKVRKTPPVSAVNHSVGRYPPPSSTPPSAPTSASSASMVATPAPAPTLPHPYSSTPPPATSDSHSRHLLTTL